MIPISRFPFRQRSVTSTDGCCAGISLALMANLRQEAAVTPAHAFMQARRFVATMLKGRNPLRRLLNADGQRLRELVHHLQDQHLFRFIGARRIRDFHGTGTAMLELQPGRWGTAFGQGFGTASTALHAGVLLWQDQQAFVFDPNFGGLHFDTHSPHVSAHAVDEAFAHLASSACCARWARVIDALALRPEAFDFDEFESTACCMPRTLHQ